MSGFGIFLGIVGTATLILLIIGGVVYIWTRVEEGFAYFKCLRWKLDSVYDAVNAEGHETRKILYKTTDKVAELLDQEED